MSLKDLLTATLEKVKLGIYKGIGILKQRLFKAKACVLTDGSYPSKLLLPCFRTCGHAVHACLCLLAVYTLNWSHD